MMSSEDIKADYDGPWKEALSIYFEQFLLFFFPNLHREIDWSQPYRSLDKELMELGRKFKRGTKFPDKLFEVKLRAGDPLWILIHVEVQSQYDRDFTDRIYRYNYRALDRYNRWVVSLGVLGDNNPSWRPCEILYTLDGYEFKFKFPIAKLLDYESRWQELESDDNPFALMVRAHLKTLATTGKMAERKQWKWTLIRFLFERGYNREEVVNLFRFIDRMMTLPTSLEQELKTEIIRYREEREMPFMSQIEEMAKEEGIEQGRQQGREEGRQQGTLQARREDVLEILQVRFAEVPAEVVDCVNQIEDIDLLKQLFRQAIAIPSVAQFQQLLNPETES
jgi:hypothetical protein